MELKNPDTFGIYGRLLAVMEKANDAPFSPAALTAYYGRPLLFFVKLHAKSVRNLRCKPELDNRFMLLMDLVCIEDITGLPANTEISADNQWRLQVAFSQERTFLNLSIGERIKRGRGKLSLTQEELAEKAGLKSGGDTISRYETGEVEPSEDTTTALREVLGYEYI